MAFVISMNDRRNFAWCSGKGLLLSQHFEIFFDMHGAGLGSIIGV